MPFGLCSSQRVFAGEAFRGAANDARNQSWFCSEADGHMKRKPAKKKRSPEQANAKPPAVTDQVLIGWPKIAAYLGQPVSVAQRWAKSGMPVERKGRSMTARSDDLRTWLGKETGVNQPVRISQSNVEDLTADLRRGLHEARNRK